MTDYSKHRLIDLFCGCGGMTQGFVDTGSFEPVLANDFNDAAIESYRANFDPSGKHSVGGPIEDFLATHRVPAADVVIGGPPCQGFSLLNKKRHGDVRRTLWYQFMKVVDRCGAKVIVMENVRQLLTSPEYGHIEAELGRLGFHHIAARVLCAANHGVPEMRYRAIIVASRMGPIALPVPSHCSPEKLKQWDRIGNFFAWDKPAPWRTVRDAIGELAPPEGTEVRGEPPPYNIHFGRSPTEVSLARYRAVPPGGNRFDLQKNRPDITPGCWIRKTSGGTDLFGRLWWDRPSVTIRTEFFKPEKGRYLHPDQDRPITHREAARIQSFPDEFVFVGSKVEIARQIGNAVPPLLAQAIARQVADALEDATTGLQVAEADRALEWAAGPNGRRKKE